MAGASIEAGVTKYVRVCWRRQRGVQRTKGRQQVTYSRAKRRGRIGRAKPKEAAHRDVDYPRKFSAAPNQVRASRNPMLWQVVADWVMNPWFIAVARSKQVYIE